MVAVTAFLCFLAVFLATGALGAVAAGAAAAPGTVVDFAGVWAAYAETARTTPGIRLVKRFIVVFSFGPFVLPSL